MPGGDRTGPLGMGAMSGRAAGYCAGADMPGYFGPYHGRGFGIGFGRARGTGRGGPGGPGGFGYGGRNSVFASGLPGRQQFGGVVPFADDPVYTTQSDPEWEKQVLKRQADYLRSELDYINRRIAEVEPGDSEE